MVSLLTKNAIARILGTFFVVFFLAFTPLQIVSAQQSNTDFVNAAAESSGLGVEIGVWIMSTGSYITLFGGSLLDNALENFVVKLSSTLSASGKKGIGYVIDSSWAIVRDVSNIIFIFAFIYIGIATILNPTSSRLKGFIAQLIIAAVLINFSLFFVKVIIDAANFFATQTLVLFQGSDTSMNLAYSFIHSMGLSTLYEISDATIASFSSGGAVAFFIAGTLFLLVAGFVFAAAAILLTIRFVALILFMIFSPLLFAGSVFTSMKKWWMMLISYAVYAPVFLFLMYLSVRILNESTWLQATDLATLLAAGADRTEGFAVILQFTIATIFLLLSLKAADTLGVAGGKTAINVGNKIRGYGQRAVGAGTFGLAAGIGRGTIGAGAQAISEKEGLKEAASRGGVRGFAARRALKGSRVVADTSFDARNVGGVGKTLGIGEGRKGGYKTAREDVKKKEEKFAKSLGEVGSKDTAVKSWQDQIDITQTRVQDLKDQIATTNSPEAKRRLRGELNAAQFELTNYQEAIKYEKNRRQIGSAAANATLATMSDEDREFLNNSYVLLAEETDPTKRRELLEGIQTTKAGIKKDLKEQQAPKKKQGYAGVLESSIFGAFTSGRAPWTETYAGEQIRKGVEKNIGKSKEDARIDRLSETLKSAA